jgi:O-antigen/teichoic acid export membrane protein
VKSTGRRGNEARAEDRPEVDSAELLDSPEATQRVIRGSLIRTISYIVSIVAGVAALPFLFRYLGVVDTGRYVTVVTIVTAVGALVESGLAAISVREYSLRAPNERAVLMTDLLGLRIAAVGLSAACAVVFMVIAGYSSVLLVGAGVAIVGALLESVSSVYGVWLSTSLRLGWLAAMQVVRQVVAVILTVLLVVVQAPLIDFFALLLIAGFAQLVVGYVATRSAIPHLPSRNVRAWGRLVRTSGPYIAAMAIGVLYFRVAMILMSALSSATQTGYFGVPFRLLEIVTLVSVLMLSSAFPILARTATRDRARHRYALRRLSDVALIVGAWVAVVVLVGAGFIVELLAGSSFGPSVDVLRVLTVCFVAKFVIASWAFALLSLEEYRGVLAANIAATAVAIALTFLAVPPLGAMGGALATIVADITLVAAYGWVLVRKSDDVNFTRRTTVGVLLASACAAALALTPIPDVPRMVLATVVFGGVLLITKSIPSELAMALPWRRVARNPAS